MASQKRVVPTARRRMTPAARRIQLLETSIPVFARRGFAGAGTRDLARAAGITEPILYRHFADKAELFREALGLVETRVIAALEDVAQSGARGAEARLKALAQNLPGLLERCRDELRVLNAAALAHEEPAILRAAARCAGGIGRALGGLFRGSGLRRGIPASTAGFLLLELGLGASMLRPLNLAEMEGPTFTDRAVKGLLHGIVG